MTLTASIGPTPPLNGLPLAAASDGLLDLLPVGVCFCDAEGVIERYNRRAAELWGREPTPGDARERFCGSSRLYHPDGSVLPHRQGPTAQALRTGSPRRNQPLVIERPDGSRVTALANAEPLRDATGSLVGAVCVL